MRDLPMLTTEQWKDQHSVERIIADREAQVRNYAELLRRDRLARLHGIVRAGQLFPHQPLMPEMLIDLACAYYGVSPAKLRDGDRHQQYSMCRATIAAMLRAEGRSYPDIARAMGGRNHSSMIAAVRFAAKHCKQQIAELRSIIAEEVCKLTNEAKGA